jgi:AcrR family transcriptional regulator
VAARAGLKYQIVFYYFGTMDDLLLAAYRRSTDVMWARIEEALGADRPLHAFWEMWSNPFDGAVSLEFMALANHNDMIRTEKIAFGARVRRLAARRLADRLKDAPDQEVFTPFAVSMALSCVGGILAFEDALGLAGGHEETRRLVAWCLDRLEPGAAPAKPARRAARNRRPQRRAGN